MGRPRSPRNAHLPKSVYERSGSYYYDRKKGGRPIPLGKDLNQALALYERLSGAMQPEGALDPQIDAAMKIVYAGGAPGQRKPLSAGTKRTYASYVKIIKRALRQFTDPSQIKGRDIAKLKTLMLEKHGLVPANTALSILRNVCAFWMENEIIDTNVAAGVRLFPGTKRRRLITAEEFNAIYDHADDELRAILNLWRLTGQRVMDVVRLRRENIREEGLYFRQQKTSTPLIIGWNPALRDAIDRAKALNNGVATEWLFFRRSYRGRNKGKIVALAYNTCRDHFAAAAKAAGVENVQQRDLRAMALTAVARELGVDAAQALAAHRDKRTTETYIRERGETNVVVAGPSFGQAAPLRTVVNGKDTKS